MKNIICFCMSVLLFCFGGWTEQTSAENMTACEALCVQGNQLVNKNGVPVQLKGISTHGIAWFPEYINEQCFQELKQNWGMNVIRIALYTAENGGYCTDGNKEQLKSLVKKGIDTATKCNLYVIVDWHILSDGNPNTHIEEAKVFFDEISKTYGKQTNIIYEICNEPNGGTSWEEIKRYAEEVIAVIRKNDANNMILVGTPNWSQFVDQAVNNRIANDKNVMYTLHFYAGTHKQELRNTMKKAIEGGLPIFVSEYGICDASGNGQIDIEQANEWIKCMNDYKVSYVAWNLSNKAETSAILKSDCQKKSGFTENDLSDTGKWLYQMLTNKNVSQIPKIENTIYTSNINTDINTNDFSVSANVVNHWEQGTKQYYQYDVVIKNKSAYDKNQWSVSIPFDGNVILVNGWNGNFNVNANCVNITSMNYNGSVKKGENISNIGFIICADKKVSVKP